MDLVTLARVNSVHPDHVVYTLRSPDGTISTHEIPTNFVLWSTGIAMNSLTRRVSNLLPNQVHKKAIEVDAHLRVKGAPMGEVYAIGDCATVCILFWFLLVLYTDVVASRSRHPSCLTFWSWLTRRTRIKMAR